MSVIIMVKVQYHECANAVSESRLSLFPSNYDSAMFILKKMKVPMYFYIEGTQNTNFYFEYRNDLYREEIAKIKNK